MGKSIFYRSGNELWFMGIYSNNLEDVEGDIFTEKSHEEYAQWLRETGIAPPITVAHQPHYADFVHKMHYLGLLRGEFTPEEFSANLKTLYKPYAIAEAKAVIPANGFNIVIGKVYDNKREAVERLTERSDQWGMSHGFLIVDADDNIINSYRTFEFSILPTSIAANKMTAFGLSEEGLAMEEKGISKEDREKLEEYMASVDLDAVEEGTKLLHELMKRVLKSKTILDLLGEQKTETAEEETTQQPEETVAEEAVEEKGMPYAEIRLKLADDLNIGGLTETLATIADKLTAVEAAQAALDGRLTAAEKAQRKTEDDIVAQAFTADWTVPQWNRLSVQGKQTADENTTEEELLDELKKNVPPEADQKAIDANPLNWGLRSVFSS